MLKVRLNGTSLYRLLIFHSDYPVQSELKIKRKFYFCVCTAHHLNVVLSVYRLEQLG